MKLKYKVSQAFAKLFTNANKTDSSNSHSSEQAEPMTKNIKKVNTIKGTPFDIITNEETNLYYIFWGKHRINMQDIRSKKEAENWLANHFWETVVALDIIIAQDTIKLQLDGEKLSDKLKNKIK